MDTTTEGLERINFYLHCQLALGNWPYDDTWDGDEVLLAVVDVYDAVANFP